MNEPRTGGGFGRILPWALLALTLVAGGAALGWPYRHRLRSD